MSNICALATGVWRLDADEVLLYLKNLSLQGRLSYNISLVGASLLVYQPGTDGD